MKFEFFYFRIQTQHCKSFLKDDKRLKRFELYLQRHIELDGDIHSVLAKKLVASICKSEKEWALAEESALTAINSRLDLSHTMAGALILLTARERQSRFPLFAQQK